GPATLARPGLRNCGTLFPACHDRLESRSHITPRARALGYIPSPLPGLGRSATAVTAVARDGGWASVAPFEVQYVVMMGDVDNDGFVKNADASAVYAHVSFLPVPDDSRYDINGDGYVQNADASAIYPRVSFLRKPTKPSGH
ncbi:MAG: dockerin type I domain-containing protein, partial [Planctomycetota bacterium]